MTAGFADAAPFPRRHAEDAAYVAYFLRRYVIQSAMIPPDNHDCV
jgi:hypothetical protein